MRKNDFTQSIENARAIIFRRRNELAQSAELTRDILINPILHALGYNMGDKDSVRVQKGTDGKIVYHLKGRPQFYVETRRLFDLTIEDPQKMMEHYYDISDYYAITDGMNWTKYDTYSNSPASGFPITSVNLIQDSFTDCLHSLIIWSTTHCTTEFPEGRWFTFKEITEATPENTTVPYTLRFADGTVRPVRSWTDILPCLLDWMSKYDDLESAFPSDFKRKIQNLTLARTIADSKSGVSITEVIKNASDMFKYVKQDSSLFAISLSDSIPQLCLSDHPEASDIISTILKDREAFARATAAVNLPIKAQSRRTSAVRAGPTAKAPQYVGRKRPMPIASRPLATEDPDITLLRNAGIGLRLTPSCRSVGHLWRMYEAEPLQPLIPINDGIGQCVRCGIDRRQREID